MFGVFNRKKKKTLVSLKDHVKDEQENITVAQMLTEGKPVFDDPEFHFDPDPGADEMYALSAEENSWDELAVSFVRFLLDKGEVARIYEDDTDMITIDFYDGDLAKEALRKLIKIQGDAETRLCIEDVDDEDEDYEDD